MHQVLVVPPGGEAPQPLAVLVEVGDVVVCAALRGVACGGKLSKLGGCLLVPASGCVSIGVVHSTSQPNTVAIKDVAVYNMHRALG